MLRTILAVAASALAFAGALVAETVADDYGEPHTGGWRGPKATGERPPVPSGGSAVTPPEVALRGRIVQMEREAKDRRRAEATRRSAAGYYRSRDAS